MPYLPELPTWEKSIINTQQFLGLNRGLSISDGEMADMLNMSSDNFPVLSTRQPRGVPEFHHSAAIGHVLPGKVQGMLGTDRLVVCHDGKVYVDGIEVPITLSTEAGMKEKKLVSMGAYVCIWPDRKYFNVNNLDDSGDMGQKWEAAEGEKISAMMCRLDGTDYDMEKIVVGDTAPTSPADGDFWLDMSGEKDVLKQYSKLHAQWVQVATTYIKIQATGIGKGLKKMDAVWLSDVAIDTENTETVEPGTITVNAKSIELKSTWREWRDDNGVDMVTTDPTPDEATFTLTVEGIPWGAVVSKAYLHFDAAIGPYPWVERSDNVLTLNGKSFIPGEGKKIKASVSGNGTYSFKFFFDPYYIETGATPGYYTETLNISNIRLVVDYDPAVLTDYEEDVDQANALNASNIVYGCGDDYIIVAGLLHRSLTLMNTLKAEMKIPNLDYVCEANNRLWGCRYAEDDGTVVNELRCCALGDFRNWSKFIGTAADSYTMTLGSDGVFTGAYSYQGTPIFFKESYIHKVTGTVPANYTMLTIQGRGVQEGSWASLKTVNETLFYKARNDIMAYEGAMPYSVGAKLGQDNYSNAVAGGYRDKYYLCMQDEALKWHTYVLDTAKGLWHQEGTEKIAHMATAGGELVLAVEGAESTELRTVGNSSGADEAFAWSVTFGVLGYQSEQQKYLSRYNIRAQMSAGSHMKVEMQYDSNGKWVHMGTMKSPRLQTFLLPIIPRRCDHCQLRISGTGRINIYSVAREYENGGDG